MWLLWMGQDAGAAPTVLGSKCLTSGRILDASTHARRTALLPRSRGELESRSAAPTAASFQGL